jgi:hypothetical protein
LVCHAADQPAPVSGLGLLSNSNRLLLFGESAFQSAYIARYTGVKTGSTYYAGNCLVAAAELVDGRELISVILGAHDADRAGSTFIYSRTLLHEAASRILGPVPTSTPEPEPSATPPPPSPLPTPTQAAFPTHSAPTETGDTEPAAQAGFWRADPWRTAFILLLPVTLAAGLAGRRRRRKPIRPRRVLKRMDSQPVCHPFEPVWSPSSQVLILGTMPSLKSRLNQFYYGHPQNRFWPLLSRLFDCPVPQTIDARRALILDHQLALWDVLLRCTIRGSADSSIGSPTVNPIADLVTRCPISWWLPTDRRPVRSTGSICRPGSGCRWSCCHRPARPMPACRSTTSPTPGRLFAIAFPPDSHPRW